MRGEEKRENWLLIKVKDSESRESDGAEFLESLASSVTTARSMEEIAAGETAPDETLDQLVKQYPNVQLATLVEEPPTGDGWLNELKFDGYRLLGFASAGKARLFTRNGNDWTHRFSSLAAALTKLKADDAVLDMEAVVLDPDGKSNFQGLQDAVGDGGDETKITAYLFDILHLNGKDLTKLPLTQRKDALEKLLKNSSAAPRLRYSSHVVGQGAEMLAKACEAGLEGIISKVADAPYSPGRQKSWLKIKCSKRQEFIILGFSEARSGGRALGAVYLGYRQGGALRYAGKVGTGFSTQSAIDLTDKFKKLEDANPVMRRAEMTGVAAGEWRTIHWVQPVLLCEVGFTEWTKDGRIRHPSFQGLREDKDAGEVKKEVPVETPAKPKAVAKKASGNLILDGITITHPDRVISEMGHVTKGEVAEYYAGVAAMMLPSLVNRPLSLLRCPAGIDGECFFQRNPGKGLGKDVKPFEFKHKGKTYHYLYIEDEKGLLEVIQMGTIELHPWGSTVESIGYPDRMIFDLDPAPDVPFEAVKLAALDLRKRLEAKGLQSVVKTTGGKGLHVTVPLSGKDDWPAVKEYAGALAKEMVAAAPEAYVATMTKAKRTGKIFIDFFRNDYTATAIADYGVRARPGAPVAAPIEWKELKKLTAGNQFTMKDVLKRVKGKTPASPIVQSLPLDL